MTESPICAHTECARNLKSKHRIKSHYYYCSALCPNRTPGPTWLEDVMKSHASGRYWWEDQREGLMEYLSACSISWRQ